MPARGNRSARRRRDQFSNTLLVSLAKCAYSDSPMAFVAQGERRAGATRKKRYLVCDAARRGVRHDDGRPVCTFHSVRYDECEALVLSNCEDLRPEQVLPTPDEKAELCRSLRRQVEAKDVELEDIDNRIKNLNEQIEVTIDAAR